MSLSATSYFEHLKAYVNRDYMVHDGVDKKVVLTEKYFREQDVHPQTRKIELLLPGVGFVFKLDYDYPNTDTSKRKIKPPLFHFLDDTAKPWSKRCDFVIFYVSHKRIHADCIEFKSKSLTADNIVPQLKAGVSWVRSLKHTIEYYTSDSHKIYVRKFVFAENETPEDYLDANRQLKADPSIRYYHFDEVDGRELSVLENISTQVF